MPVRAPEHLFYLFPFCSFSYHAYLLTSRIGPFHFQAGGHRRRLNLKLFFVIIFYVCVALLIVLLQIQLLCQPKFCILHFLVFFTFFSVLAKRVSGKSVPEMTFFVSSVTLTIYSINQSILGINIVSWYRKFFCPLVHSLKS